MQIRALEHIACPAKTPSGVCHGKIGIVELPVPPRFEASDDTDVIEGLLGCSTCGATYPVVCGLAILVEDPLSYVRDNYTLILAMASENGAPLSSTMITHLQSLGADLGGTGIDNAAPYNASGRLRGYIAVHYDNVLDLYDESHSFHDILSRYYSRDFYSVLEDAAMPYLSPDGIVLDLGCGVGRGCFDFALKCRFVYGLEFSYASAFVARQILRGLPRQLETYRLPLDGDRYLERALPTEHRLNTEVLIGSALNVPCIDQAFDLVLNWNVIDRVPDPMLVLREQVRCLKAGGIVSFTDPYDWTAAYTPHHNWLGGKYSMSSEEAVRNRLRESMHIEVETPDILWMFWEYAREFYMISGDAIIARRRS